MEMRGKVKIRGHIKIEKYDAEGRLFETLEADNLFLNTGINEIWNLVCGGSANPYNNANAQIGIGDSGAAAAAGQTDLQAATNKTYKGMAASYPQFNSGQQAVFQSIFGSTDANYAWNEFVVKNGASAICIDRGVGSFGTKASGTTWTATVTLSMS